MFAHIVTDITGGILVCSFNISNNWCERVAGTSKQVRGSWPSPLLPLTHKYAEQETAQLSATPRNVLV